MTTYLGEKAVGIGTIKATKAVAGDVLHDETLVGNGNTEPLGVDKQVIATTNQVANLSVTLHAAIEAQADMITEHAEELTTLRGNQASLGDQVSGIEEKIPGGASATNQLATKADLKDVGGDFVKKSGDTMTGILTIQAEEDYDPSTPPVGGLSFKSNASPDGFTNRMRQVANGFIAIEYLLNGKQYSNLVFSDQEIYIDNTENGTGNPVSLGTSGNPWDNVYAKKLNNGADVVIPTEGGTLARKEDLIDLRADINEADSELQSQITAQAGAIAGLESDKLDRNLDPLNAGKYLIVGDDGNVELTTSGGGGGIANVIHDSTLSGKGTDNEPLGVAKNLEVEELTVGTDEGTLNLSITAGVATIATNNGLDIVSQTKFDKAPTTDDNTTYANALDVSLMRKAQVATAISDALDNVDALPDQMGNAGKFLTTDGTSASWGELPDNVLVNNSSFGTALSIGTNANADVFGVALGNAAKTLSTGSIAIGSGSNGNGAGIAIGMQAKTGSNSTRAIQLGFNATNSDSNTFKVANSNGNFEMMSADGTIPADRMSTTAGTTGQVLTKTDTGMGWSDVSSTRIIFREWE